MLQPLPGNVRVIALANQKGGVGKTTTAINLGTALAAIGETVLIVDLDPQGNASTGLGVDRKERTRSTYDVMVGEATLSEVAVPTAVPRLMVAPSTMDLLGVELEIAGESDRNYRLRKAIIDMKDAPGPPTYVLVDCPPSLNLLTINAMVAAHSVLVPLQCEFFALEGLTQLINTVEQVQKVLNQGLAIHGIVLTMYDVYETIIPRNVRISEAPSHGKPVLLYDFKSTGSQAYLRLASEIIQREKHLRAA